MYIKANHFDYDKLLGGIVEHLDLKDEPLTTELVNVVLKTFENNYKVTRQKQELEDWQEKIVVSFLSSVQSMVKYTEFIAIEDEEEFLEEDNYHQVLGRVLDDLSDLFEGDGEDKLWMYVESFWDNVCYNMNPQIEYISTPEYNHHFKLPNGAVLTPGQLANFLREWVESYLSSFLTGVDEFLFDNINNQILPQEFMQDINILDIPGSKAKHGDTLITFPLILLEVHNR